MNHGWIDTFVGYDDGEFLMVWLVYKKFKEHFDIYIYTYLFIGYDIWEMLHQLDIGLW